MHRRTFGRTTAAALAGLALSPVPLRRLVGGGTGWKRVGRDDARPSPLPGGAPLRVDRERLLKQLEELSRFGATGDGGVSRPAFSEADLEAREYVRELMGAAGLETRVDAAGNLLGRRPGSEAGLPPLMAGSHVDSVPQGGRFDGPLGVLAAVESARTLEEEGISTRHPLEVVVFSNEEDGKTGSRAMAGEVEPDELDRVTNSGRTIREGMRLQGGDPDRLDEVRRRPGDAAAFLELHVEQGAVLERSDTDIGVVLGIVGIKRWFVAAEGMANHAGTTPMDQRRDALVAASRFVEAVNRVARRTPGRHVATVGRIEAFPGAANVIPGRVEHTLEVRDLEMEKIDRIFARLRERAAEIGEETGTEFSFDRYYVSRSAPTAPELRELVEGAARELGLSARRVPSGAGHDAQSIARFAPVGMAFVPSAGGISHSPDEFTRPEDVGNGADVLLNALVAADGRTW